MACTHHAYELSSRAAVPLLRAALKQVIASECDGSAPHIDVNTAARRGCPRSFPASRACLAAAAPCDVMA